MITYAELTSEVLANLEIGTSDLTRFKVLEHLNSAQLSLLNSLPIPLLNDVVKTSLFNLTNGVSAYQWPPDLIRFSQMWLNFSAGITLTAPGAEVSLWTPDTFIAPIKDVATTSYPYVDIDIEQGFAIYPTPTASVTEGGRIRYVYKIPDIATSQPSLLNANLKNLLVFRATAMSAMIENYNHELASKYDEYYREELATLLPKSEKK